MKIDNPQKIEKVEIVVGIPSYHEAKTIGFVVEQVNLGTKIHNSSIPKLGHMFNQVAETLFELILKNKGEIKRKTEIKKPLILGGEKLLSCKTGKIHQTKEKAIDCKSWVKTVYDSLIAYSGNRDVIKELRDLYLTRLTLLKSERDVLEQAKCFLKQRDYFLDKI